MEDSFLLLCPNRTEVRRFQKNHKSEDNFFEYIFIDTGLIVGIYDDKTPLMKTRVSVKIEQVRAIYRGLISRVGKNQTMLVSIID